MSDINLKGFDSIKAEKRLIERTIYYVAHPEPISYQTYIKRIAVSVISLLVLFGGYYFFNNSDQHHSSEITVSDDGGLKIPAIQLPKNTETPDMVGLIVYNGKI